MSNAMLSERAPRILFFGMQGSFSVPPLTALLESGAEVCAVVIPASPIPGRATPSVQRREPPRLTRSALPLLTASTHPSIVQLAWARQIPVWEVHRLSDTETVSILAAYRPDVLCVTCFSLRIPRIILDLPRLGCLNVHPSLLPANRGPVPLFWTFREGHNTTGLTIHRLDEGMDSGDILAQESIEVPDGISYTQLEALCAIRGGTLLAQTVWDMYHGRTIYVPQDEMKSSYHTFPFDEDFVVHAEEWSARHVYNFIQGIGHWDAPIELHAHDEAFLVREAFSYSLENTRKGEHGWVQCKDGWVHIKILDTVTNS